MSSPSFLGNYNRATYRGTARSFFSLLFFYIVYLYMYIHLSFFFSLSRSSRSPVPSCSAFAEPLILFRGNCVYETTRELQSFVIPWNCRPFVDKERSVHILCTADDQACFSARRRQRRVLRRNTLFSRERRVCRFGIFGVVVVAAGNCAQARVIPTGKGNANFGSLNVTELAGIPGEIRM